MDESQPTELPTLDQGIEPINSPSSEALGNLGEVKVEISVEVGRRVMKLAETLELSSGSIIPLDREADQPLDFLVNGKVVAKGEVVVVENHFGIRITEILSPDLGTEL